MKDVQDLTDAEDRGQQREPAIVGRCPGCGRRIKLEARGGICPSCRTPLPASVGELDAELAVRARLYPERRSQIDLYPEPGPSLDRAGEAATQQGQAVRRSRAAACARALRHAHRHLRKRLRAALANTSGADTHQPKEHSCHSPRAIMTTVPASRGSRFGRSRSSISG